MFFLRYVLAAAFAAAFFSPARAADSAAAQYARLLASGGGAQAAAAGRSIEVDVDLSGGEFTSETVAGRLQVHYRMAFNQVAEGWSWQPLADPAREDYYRFVYLPLQSVIENRGDYPAEDKIGSVQRMRVVWRYDYFLAFDNLYDFYPRGSGDDAGFSASLPVALTGRVGLRAVARLVAPALGESTTFLKATHGRPTDFTLKKRYLIGHLDQIDFIDRTDGRVLCRILPGHAQCGLP